MRGAGEDILMLQVGYGDGGVNMMIYRKSGVRSRGGFYRDTVTQFVFTPATVS